MDHLKWMTGYWQRQPEYEQCVHGMAESEPKAVCGPQGTIHLHPDQGQDLPSTPSTSFEYIIYSVPSTSGFLKMNFLKNIILGNP